MSRPTVLQFFGDSPRGTVRHGMFWAPEVNLGPFFWEFWIKPGINESRYIISDGYGGKHALAAGFAINGDPDQEMKPEGPMWTGVTSVAFASDEGVYSGEWCHVAFGWGPDPDASSAKALITYVNGIPVGYVIHNGTRQSGATIADGCGDLFVGGSNHSNYVGLLAMIRGFEGTNPLDYPRASFTPDNAFGPQACSTPGTFVDAVFLASYMTLGATIIPDCSPRGFDGVDNETSDPIHHAGAVFGCEALGIARGFPNSSPSTFPRPSYVQSSDCPVGSATVTVPTLDVPALSPCPEGARIFDSFDRTQQNFAWQAAPTLGDTDERASLGALTWTPWLVTGQGGGESSWGIRNGRAVCLQRTVGASVVVDNGSATMDIRVARLAGSNGVIYTAIAHRFQDNDNFYFAYVFDNNTVRIARFTAGAVAPVDGEGGFVDYDASSVPSWQRLRVVNSGTTITYYVGALSGAYDANGFPLYTWTQIGQLTGQTSLQTETKVGLCGVPYALGGSGLYRYDNFEVR